MPPERERTFRLPAARCPTSTDFQAERKFLSSGAFSARLRRPSRSERPHGCSPKPRSKSGRKSARSIRSDFSRESTPSAPFFRGRLKGLQPRLTPGRDSRSRTLRRKMSTGRKSAAGTSTGRCASRRESERLSADTAREGSGSLPPSLSPSALKKAARAARRRFR